MESWAQSSIDIDQIADAVRRHIEQRLPAVCHSEAETPRRPSPSFVVARSQLEVSARLHNAVSQGEALVGRLPPQPPTMRGRLGALLIVAVRRILFWYTPQIHRFQHETAAALQEQARAIEDVSGEVHTLQASIRALRSEIDELRKQSGTPKSAMPAGMSVRLHNLFRGSRADIKSRLRVYMPLVDSASPPVLDLGSGRGEWLELLRDNGIPAKGVDLNEEMVRGCIDEGLDAQQGDALLYLHRQPSDSIGVITGFHIAEHMPFAALIELVTEIVRVLKPGGLVIFETPDPENVLVGTNSFHYDPTHVRPLPRRLMTFMFEEMGLLRLDIFHLHPGSTKIDNPGDPIAALVNWYFYGPKDYGVVGWKP